MRIVTPSEAAACIDPKQVDELCIFLNDELKKFWPNVSSQARAGEARVCIHLPRRSNYPPAVIAAAVMCLKESGWDAGYEAGTQHDPDGFFAIKASPDDATIADAATESPEAGTPADQARVDELVCHVDAEIERKWKEDPHIATMFIRPPDGHWLQTEIDAAVNVLRNAGWTVGLDTVNEGCGYTQFFKISNAAKYS